MRYPGAFGEIRIEKTEKKQVLEKTAGDEQKERRDDAAFFVGAIKGFSLI